MGLEDFEKTLNSFSGGTGQEGAVLNLNSAHTLNPDEEADKIRLQRATGIPANLMSDKKVKDDAKRQAFNQSFDLSNSPATVNFLRDPSMANVAKDDLTFMQKFEDKTRQLRRLWEDAIAPTPARAYATAKQGMGGAYQFVGENVLQPFINVFTPESWKERYGRSNIVTIFGQNMYNDAKFVEQQIQREHPLDPGSFPGMLSSALQSMYLQAPMLGAGYIVPTVKAGTAATLAGMGAVTGGQTYSERRSRGFTPNAATASAAWDATVEVGTELLPTKTLFDLLKPSAKQTFARAALKVGELYGEEMVGESLATFLQDANDKFTDSPTDTLSQRIGKISDYITSGEALQNWISTIGSTAIQTTLMGGAGIGVNRFAQGRLPKAKQENKELIDTLTATEESRLKQRLPEGFADFAQKVGDQHNISQVYFQADKVVDEAIKSGMNENQVVEWLNQYGVSPQELDTAIRTDGKIAFDYGKVAQNFNSDPVLTGLQKDMLISPFSISEDQVDSTVNAEVENLIHISELYNKEQESKIGQDDIALWEKAILETPGLRGKVTKESLLPLIARANVLSSLTNTPAIEHLNRMLQPTGLRAEKYKDFKARQEEKISQEVNANGQMQTETEIAKEGAIENKNPLPPNNSIVLNQSGEKGKGLVVIDKKGTANIPAKDNPKADTVELTSIAKQYDNPYDFINNTLYESAWHGTQYFNGKIYNYRGLDSISDLKNLESSFQHRKQKVFYRATNNQNEHRIDVKSKNYLTGESYDGMSVYYTPLYKQEWIGSQPKAATKYIGVVKGVVIGYGHDGEPLITNVKWIQKPVEKLPKKYSRENIEVIDRETPLPWGKLDYGIMGGRDTFDKKAPITKQELFDIWNKAHKLPGQSSTPEEGVQSDLYQSDTTNPLGSLSITHDGQNIISLFEKANRSTFLHETAHIFLNDLKYISETQGVQTAEWNKVKEWLGIGEDGNITVEQHEKFADHFEAYLKEGRAPTTELRNAFRKFKRWLVRIYDLVTSSRDLNVTVSPEISDLFDHLLATEQEIQATREQAALIAMLDDKLLNETGLTQEQLDEYRNIVAQAEESGFERRDKHKLKGREERLKTWRRQANAEAANVPLFGLLNRLKESGGVSRKSIIEKYGDDNIPASHPIFKKDGLDIDMAIAEHGFDYGYESAGSFIGDFKTSPNESLWVKKRIAQLEMEHDYQQDTKEAIRTASLRRQLEIESEVLANRIAKEEQAHEKQQQEIEQRWKDADRKLKEAIKLDKKNDEIHWLREKLALAKQRAKKPEATSRAVLREWAKRVVSLRTIRQINNINSLIFESYRHRQEAISCARQGKWTDAFNANEQARMTEALITESYKVVKEWGKMEARWKNVAKWTNENKDVKVGTRFRDQINRILNLYGLSERKFDPSIPDLQSFVASLGAGDELNSAGASLSPWINVEVGNYTTLNWQQLQELHEAINYLYGHGRDEIEGAKLSNGQRAKDYADEIVKAQEGIKNIKYLMTDATRIGRLVQGVQNNYRKFFAHTAILRFIAQRLDGYQNVGGKHKMGFSEQLVQNINTALAKSNDMWMGKAAKVEPLLKVLTKDGRKVFGDLRLPDKFNQYGMTWTKERVVAACLNMGNDSNMQRLRDGFGLVDEDIHAIASKLTVEEWQTIQKIWDTVNSLWPQIADVHERLNYFRPKKQEARALKVLAADGEVELAGGYYPVMYDRSMDRDAARWSEQDDILASNEAILQVPIAKSGFTKGRAGKVERPLHLSLSVLGRHLNDAIRYITLSEVIRDADRVFRDRKLEARNLETIGREMQDMIRPALKQTLRPDPKNIGWFEFGRTRMSLYYMGYNMWTALQNITGVFPAIRQAGAKNYLDGIYHVLSMGNPYKAHKAMLEMSGYMRLRESNIERDMKRQLRNFEMGGIEIKGRRYHFDDVRGLGFAAMRFIDATVALPAWWGVYNEQMQVNGGNIQKAVESADATVNKAIGSGLDIDTTAFQRHGFFSLLAPFMSFAAAQQEILSTERKAWKEGKISNADFIYGQMMTWVMPAVMSTFLQGVLMYGIVGALGGGDDDRKKKDMSDYITDLIAYRLMGIPFVRDIYNSALQGFEKKAPITSARMPTTEAWKMIQDLSYRVGNYDGSEKSVKALGWSSAETISLTSGIPTSRIYQRWIKGTDDIESGSGWWGNHFIPQERKK